MTLSSHDRLGNLMLRLTDELKPFVERQLEAVYKQDWTDYAKAPWRDGALHWDFSTLIGTMVDQWNPVFRHSLRLTDRDILFSLREDRNKWAHQGHFTTDDAYDTFNNAERLLASIHSPLSASVKQQKRELLQIIHEEEQERLRKEQEAQEREQWEREQRQHLLETLLPVYLSDPQGEIIQAMLAILKHEQSLNKVTAAEVADYFKRMFGNRSNKQEVGERQIPRTPSLKSGFSVSSSDGGKSGIEAQGLQRVKEALETAGYQAELFQRNVLRIQSEAPVTRTVPRLIRIISATEESFNIRERYKDIENGLLAFVWYAHDPLQAVIYTMTYAEALDIADKKRWTLTDSWRKKGYYSTTRPDRTLMDYLKPYEMTPDKWRNLLRREIK